MKSILTALFLCIAVSPLSLAQASGLTHDEPETFSNFQSDEFPTLGEYMKANYDCKILLTRDGASLYLLGVSNTGKVCKDDGKAFLLSWLDKSTRSFRVGDAYYLRALGDSVIVIGNTLDEILALKGNLYVLNRAAQNCSNFR